ALSEPSIDFLDIVPNDYPDTEYVSVLGVARIDSVFESATGWNSLSQYDQMGGNWSLKIDRLDGSGGSVVATATIDVYAYHYLESGTLAYFVISDDNVDPISTDGTEVSSGGSALIDIEALGVAPASGSALYVGTLTFTESGYSSARIVSSEVTLTTS
ncbi:MAG: hypothetical protein VXB01_06155, partial [Opitutae bacterium]